jgi:uncharacterized linocin/CFP29 family protein
MDNKYLERDSAPISADTWKLLDDTMIAAAKSRLAGRRLISIEGPFGFGLKVIPMGDSDGEDGVVGSTFIPVSLIKSEFTLGKRDLASYEKDKLAIDLNPVARAAIDCAAKEDGIIFHGVRGNPGLLTVKGSSSQAIGKWDTIGTAADQVIDAVTKLDNAGFHGPYSMALAPAEFNLLLRRYPQGEGTELDHIRTIVTEGVVKAPGMKKGGVLLASGSQYSSLAIGQDMTIGYIGPEANSLLFQVVESLALLVKAPESICVLK